MTPQRNNEQQDSSGPSLLRAVPESGTMASSLMIILATSSSKIDIGCGLFFSKKGLRGQLWARVFLKLKETLNFNPSLSFLAALYMVIAQLATGHAEIAVSLTFDLLRG